VKVNWTTKEPVFTNLPATVKDQVRLGLESGFDLGVAGTVSMTGASSTTPRKPSICSHNARLSSAG